MAFLPHLEVDGRIAQLGLLTLLLDEAHVGGGGSLGGTCSRGCEASRACFPLLLLGLFTGGYRRARHNRGRRKSGCGVMTAVAVVLG